MLDEGVLRRAIDVAPPFCEQLLQVGWQGRREIHLLSRRGVDEAQCACVEGLSRADAKAVLYERLVGAATLSAQDLRAAIACVAEERMADVAHVCADLVCASCLEDTLHERRVAEAFEYAPMGHGWLARLRVGRENGHAQTVAHVAGDMRPSSSTKLAQTSAM